MKLVHLKWAFLFLGGIILSAILTYRFYLKIPTHSYSPLILGYENSTGDLNIRSIGINTSFLTIKVNSTEHLYEAVSQANKLGNVIISIEPGFYFLTKTLSLKSDNIILRSSTMNPKDVLLHGIGMKATSSVDNLIAIYGQFITLDSITLAQTPNHLIQVLGEKNADQFTLRNCILQDAYQQMLKVSVNKDIMHSSDYGLIENNRFEYTDGIGPNYYIGGIDLHAGKYWRIRNNIFKDIASPSGRVAEHAIHVWNSSHEAVVDRNVIVDSDRGIGFGLFNGDSIKPNVGGVISNNIIFHRDNGDPYADASIVLEYSESTHVYGNSIYQAHNYPNSIEYRFKGTKNVLITQNNVNRAILARDGGKASLMDNNFGLSMEHIEKAGVLDL